MNPETSLCWHPFQEGLIALKQESLQAGLLAPHWDRVENIAGSGTPDLSWAWTPPGRDALEGHIELKYRAAPPVREDTPVVIDSVTAHQRLWWRQRWEAGGSVFVLLRVFEEYLLLPGRWAALNLGTTGMAGLRLHSSLVVPRSEVKDRTAEILEAACR